MSRETHSPKMADLPRTGTPARQDTRFAEGQRITWVSVCVNAVLTAMQLVVGFFAHSQSLIADAMHTLSDIVADAFVLFANRKGAEAADADHPYGHGRFETAASLVLGLLLAGTGAGILITAAGRLQNIGSAPLVGVAAMWAAMFTLAAKEGLFRYMLTTAERLRSPMLVANAWHARADALSSLVVAAGIAGALLGFNFADAVAAIIVGAMIVRAGLKFGWAAIRELIDTGLSAEEVAAIRKTIATTPGVLGMHELRTRRMAHQVLVDAHVQVNPRISVSEGHRVAETVRQRVLDSHPEVLDVLVHVDPENDLLGNAAVALPDRAFLLAHLRELLGADPPELERTLLHYLGARVEAEVFLPPGFADDAEIAAIRQRVAAALPGDSWFIVIHLNQRIAPI
ncbi:cation diffusion facilitator family transporter [Sulfuritalea sp.]|uniref:cation diffusion facilitator family transporter n=1 Tax=Sulfuritalea sp. TaxID=2480090 RepID=UPI00286E5C88|nr:cation diffusion facilitator family transporter [Sulfuritalea sp.]